MSVCPRFTVIISGYRCEPYLPKALASVAAQAFRDFEAICYVEESPDDSLAGCREFAARDPRFKVATGPKSGGGGASRNYGIDHASGEYLVFLDGDDWLFPDMLESLDQKLRGSSDLDVLAFAAVSVESEEFDPGRAEKFSNFSKADAGEVFDGWEAIRRSRRNGGGIHGHTWLNTYRTEFIRENDLHQSIGLLLEDFEWTPRVFAAAEKMSYLDRVFYVYRRRPGSLTTERSSRIAVHAARQFVSLTSFASERSFPRDILSAFSNQWLAVLYWVMFHPVSSRKVTDAVRAEALKVLFAGNGRERFGKFAALASFPRRLAAPLLRFAAAGWQFPAKFYFRKLYYPLAERRQAKQDRS